MSAPMDPALAMAKACQEYVVERLKAAGRAGDAFQFSLLMDQALAFLGPDPTRFIMVFDSRPVVDAIQTMARQLESLISEHNPTGGSRPEEMAEHALDASIITKAAERAAQRDHSGPRFTVLTKFGPIVEHRHCTQCGDVAGGPSFSCSLPGCPQRAQRVD